MYLKNNFIYYLKNSTSLSVHNSGQVLYIYIKIIIKFQEFYVN